MLKRGVCRADQYASSGNGAAKENRIAYQLLNTSIPPSPQEIGLFESITQHLQLSGGVYRTTDSNRFQDLDAFVQPILEKQFSAQEQLLVEDWAASACVTSAEWYRLLVSRFPEVRMVASDLHLHLYEARLETGESFIFETDGKPLQYVKPPFVIPLNRPESYLIPVNRWLQSRAFKRLERLKTEGLLDLGKFPAEREEWRQPPLVFHKITLIHPQAKELVRSSKQFQIEQHSVFEASHRNSHVIRSMNIFNLGYFKAEQLITGARRVWESLRPEGLWVVGRSLGVDKYIHRATVFEKTSSGFRKFAHYAEPAEIEDLVLALKV
jgi:hypothetical protein